MTRLSALLSDSNLMHSPITDGDAGIVLKPDGSFKVFTVGLIDKDNLTESQLAQGEKMVAISLALKIPAVMAVLIQMVNDPAITGPDLISLRSAH